MARLQSIYAKEGSLVQRENWTATGVIWLIVFVFALLRGGRGGASLIPGLDCSQFLYWYLFVSNRAVDCFAVPRHRRGAYGWYLT